MRHQDPTQANVAINNVLHEWEIVRYGQDVCAKIWIAGVSMLTVLYFGKDLKP